jgi:hypothetical protein
MNRMRFFIAITFMLITSSVSLAQEEQQQSIRYYFGKKVDSVLNQASNNMNSQLLENESLLLTCTLKDSLLYVSLQTYCNNCNIYDSIGNINYWRGFLAKKSNRFYKIKDLKLPVIFNQFDLLFGVIKMIDESKGSYRSAFQLFSESEPSIIITTDIKGEIIHDIWYINVDR